MNWTPHLTAKFCVLATHLVGTWSIHLKCISSSGLFASSRISIVAGCESGCNGVMLPELEILQLLSQSLISVTTIVWLRRTQDFEEIKCGLSFFQVNSPPLCPAPPPLPPLEGAACGCLDCSLVRKYPWSPRAYMELCLRTPLQYTEVCWCWVFHQSRNFISCDLKLAYIV